MDIGAFSKTPVGRLVRITGTDGRFGEDFDHFAFIPDPLPDLLDLNQETYKLVAEASAAIARLDQAAFRLPNPYLLVRPAIRREAVSTSALEGTYAALDEVLEADFAGTSTVGAAVAEVRNYVRTAETAFEWIQTYPITVAMLESLQKILIAGTPGDGPDAGHLRTKQVFIGSSGRRVSDARFVPPPPGDQLRSGVDAWIDWINRDNSIPLVVKMALGHYQFESLHPFNDGNGRLGRLVCVLQLARAGEMRLPVLNLSPWLEREREAYQNHLLQCSITGRFDDWIQFFCEAVRVQATTAVQKIDRLHDWRDQALATLREAKVRGVAEKITEDLIGYPMLSVTDAAKRYEVTYVAVNQVIPKLVKLGLIVEWTGKKYGRLFVAREVMEIYQA
ncbi:MAG: Fic family protein [Hamadaea sp.]|uniref:Fic family protein n=1 Tax=Hamadaea sp. TaxID=2024425 RepID=UPI00181D62BF|nr:Fic/DOC family N-terminal domain-containing protein [Hamadaea sp.]NUT17943.1 Fic family protein [Hamadaea sp.]